MRRFALKYILLRTISSVFAVVFIALNLWLWGISPAEITLSQPLLPYAMLFGFQAFLFSYFGFLIADGLSRFWWNRWRPATSESVAMDSIVIHIPGWREIHGLLYHDRDLIGPGQGFIILSYGYNDNQFRARHIASGLAVAGFYVFVWDYRGREGTKGRITDLGGHLDDLTQVISFWQDHLPVPGSQIFIAGWSLGGTLSIIAGLQDPRVARVFAWSAWFDLRRNVLWRIYANPFALLRYLLKGELLTTSKRVNEIVSPRYVLQHLALDLGGMDRVQGLAAEKLFLCHARDDKLVGFENFRYNKDMLHLGNHNTYVFSKGAHFLIRSEPAVLGMIYRFFTEERR
jgi:pimeloyl-ACP methyl ester carboxylesterase